MRPDQGRQALRQRRVPAVRQPAAFRSISRNRSCATSGIEVDIDGFNAANWRSSASAAAPPGAAPARRRPRRSGSRSGQRLGATDFLGYSTEKAEGQVADHREERRRKSPRRRPATRSRSSPTRRRSTANPAARWAMAASWSPAGWRARSTVTDTQKKLGDLHVHLGKVTKGSREERRCGRDEGRSRAPLGPARASFGDPSAARGAAPPPWATT